MNAFAEYLNLGLGALFLKEEAYEKMRAEPHPVVKGLMFIVLVAVVIALVAIVGRVLEWSTSPDLSNLKNIVLSELQNMSWYKTMARDAKGLQQFQQGYDLWWQIFGPMFSVNLLGSILNLVFSPLGAIIQWFLYGVLAYLFARMLGGVGSLSQTLGCTALAIAPQMLGIAQVVPYVQLGGLAIWGLVCTYLGIKISSRLTPWRAFWATLLPPIALGLVVTVIGCCGIAAIGLVASGGQS